MWVIVASKNEQKYNVVVGGGIIGLLAYKILKSYDKNTILIEQSNKLGGLLSSLKLEIRISIMVLTI